MRDRLRRWLRLDIEPDPATTSTIERADQAMARLDRITHEERVMARKTRIDQMRERRQINLIHDRLTARTEGGD